MVNDMTGKMVATIRTVKGMNQTTLADDSKVPHSYISRFERDKMVLSDKHLAMLENALKVDFDTVRPVFEQFVAAVNATPEAAP